MIFYSHLPRKTFVKVVFPVPKSIKEIVIPGLIFLANFFARSWVSSTDSQMKITFFPSLSQEVLLFLPC